MSASVRSPILGTAIVCVLAVLLLSTRWAGAPAAPRRFDYGVIVTPDGQGVDSVYPNTNGHVVTFGVENTGSDADTYEITCGSVGPVECVSTSANGFLTLGGGDNSPVDVTFNASSGSSPGSLYLYAYGSGASDDGSYTIPLILLVVTPDGGSQSAWYPSTGNVATFTVQNTGYAGTITFTLSIQGCTAPLVNCTSDSATVQVAQGASKQVTAHFNVQDAPGIGVLTLRATHTPSGVYDNGSVNVATNPAAGPPAVSTAPYNHDHQIISRCEAACFAATYAQGTVPYFTMDAPRNVTLVYNGDRAAPRPFIHVNVNHPAGTLSTPQEFGLRVKVNGAFVPFVNGDSLRFVGSSQVVRLGGQIDASGYATGVYPLDIVVTSKYPTKTEVTTVPTKLVVVNEKASPIARAWTVLGVQRLYFDTSGILVTEGDGSGVYFRTASLNPPLGEVSRLGAGVAGTDSAYVRRYPDSTKAMFNSTGRLTRVRDRFGNTTKFLYDGSNRLWKIQDPTHGTYNREIVLKYGSAHGLDSIVDPMGRLTRVTVGSDSQLTAIRDPDNDSTRFAYDASRRLSTITDRRGGVTRFAYRSSWKVDSLVLPAVSINGGAAESPKVAYAPWQEVGVPVGPTTPNPFTPLVPDSVRGSIKDPEGHETRFTVDRWGQALRATDPLGRVTPLVRDSNGLPTQVSYPWGATETFLWASNGLLTRYIGPAQDTLNIRYSNYAQPDSVWGTRRPSQRLFIGTNGRTDSIRVASQDTIKHRFQYDSRGRVTHVKDPEGHVTRYRYHETFESVDSIAEPGIANPPGPTGWASSSTRYSRIRLDTYGRDSATAATGMPWQRVLYDVLNRPIEVYDGVHTYPTRFAYDKLFLVRVQDPKNQVYRFEHNALGWTTRRYDPADTLNRYDSYRYTRDGVPSGWTNRRAQVLTFTYDSLHRLLSKTGDNTVADTFAYSLDGLKSVAWNNVARDSVFLNSTLIPTKRVTVIGGQRFELTYFRNQAGAIDSTKILTNTAIVFPLRKLVRNYWTQKVAGLQVGTQTVGWNNSADGLRSTVNWPTPPWVSVTRKFTSSHVRQTDSVGHTALNVALGHGYGYDNVGRMLEYLNHERKQTSDFVYDNLGRLTLVKYARWAFFGSSCSSQVENGWVCTGFTTDSTKAYAYDEVGNRTDHSGTYLSGNRVQSFNGQSFSHDLDGNVTAKGCTGYTWSAEGRLTAVGTCGPTNVYYRYDALGRLVRRVREVSGAWDSTTFIWDGNQVLAELNGTATQRRSEYAYYPGIDRPMVLLTGATTVTQWRAFQQDALGNVIGVGRDTFVDQKITYDPWGAQEQVTGTLADTNRLRWKGLVWDGDGGLYYMRNRWYDPQTGRFLIEDPIGLAGGINPYAFAADDPINGSDPFGLSPHFVWGALIGLTTYVIVDLIILDHQPNLGHLLLEMATGAVTGGMIQLAKPGLVGLRVAERVAGGAALYGTWHTVDAAVALIPAMNGEHRHDLPPERGWQTTAMSADATRIALGSGGHQAVVALPFGNPFEPAGVRSTSGWGWGGRFGRWQDAFGTIDPVEPVCHEPHEPTGKPKDPNGKQEPSCFDRGPGSQ